MKNKIQDMDVKGKKVLLRCDLNVPIEDGNITDDMTEEQKQLAAERLKNAREQKQNI